MRTGETGFLANTQEEWVSAIRALASDAGLRHRLGAAARKQAEDRYSVEAGARLWLDALAGLSRESRKAG